MKSDALIRIEGMVALTEKLDLVDAERFIMLIKKESFDYTRWQETLFDGMSVEAISAEAAALRARTRGSKTKSAKSRTPKPAKKSDGGRKTVKRLAPA